MSTKNEIISHYNDLCNLAKKKLSRSEYRKLDNKFSSTLIESIWGSWSNFVKESEVVILVNRREQTKIFDKSTNTIILTHVVDGAEINEDFLQTLETYCKENNAKLGILWGKPIKDQMFDEDVYNRLKPYLATRFEFKKDPSVIAEDFLIPYTQKNPLQNLDKISTDIKTIIVGSPKQYLKTLPYKQYSTVRIGCSTGTLSELNYGHTLSGYTVSRHIDKQNHKFLRN